MSVGKKCLLLEVGTVSVGEADHVNMYIEGKAETMTTSVR